MKKVIIVSVVMFLLLSSCTMLDRLKRDLEISGEWLTNTDDGFYQYVFSRTLGVWSVPFTEMGGGFDIVSYSNRDQSLVVYFHNHVIDELDGAFAKMTWSEIVDDATLLTIFTPAENADDAEAAETEFLAADYVVRDYMEIGTHDEPINMSAFYNTGNTQLRINGIVPKGKEVCILCRTGLPLNNHTVELTYQSVDVDIYSFTPDFSTGENFSINGSTNNESIGCTTNADTYLHFSVDAINITEDRAYFTLNAST